MFAKKTIALVCISVLSACAAVPKQQSMNSQQKRTLIQADQIEFRAVKSVETQLFTPANALGGGLLGALLSPAGWGGLEEQLELEEYTATVAKTFANKLGEPLKTKLGEPKLIEASPKTDQPSFISSQAPYVLELRTWYRMLSYRSLAWRTYVYRTRTSAFLVRSKDNQIIWSANCEMMKDEGDAQTIHASKMNAENKAAIEALYSYSANSCADKLIQQYKRG